MPAAVATFRESTPEAIGIRTFRSTAARVAPSRPSDSAPRISAIRWLATVSRATHPGPEQRHNTKHVNVPVYEFARAEADESKVDEVLIFDADGLLVEGGRSNFILVTNSGRLVTPDLALGAVEGLGLTLVLENRPEIEFAELTEKDVASARELMSVNAVRGVIPIVEFAARPIADGRPGPWARRLRNLFRSEPRNP